MESAWGLACDALLHCWCKHVHCAVLLPWRFVKVDGMLSLEVLTKHGLDQAIWWVHKTIMTEFEKFFMWIVPKWIGPGPPSPIPVHQNGSHLVLGLQRLKWIGWSPKQPSKVWSGYSAKTKGTCFYVPRLWLFVITDKMTLYDIFSKEALTLVDCQEIISHTFVQQMQL